MMEQRLLGGTNPKVRIHARRPENAVQDMTEKQAQAEAIRRWGPGSTIEFRPSRSTNGRRGRLARYRCTVANGDRGSFYSIEGQGNTWREAFADARPR